MTPEEFVKALKSECADAAIDDCLTLLHAPPGRTSSQSSVELSKWFSGLGPEDQAFVAASMRNAADATLFGVLCVLDGVRVIEDVPIKSKFTVTVVCNGTEAVLSPANLHLHEILRAQN
jgi:hypothetical protein